MEVHVQNLVYTNTFLVQSISLWNQVFRDMGPFFCCQKNGKKPCGNKKLQSYRVTELQSISPGVCLATGAAHVAEIPINIDRFSNGCNLGSRWAIEDPKKTKIIRILCPRWWSHQIRSSSEGIVTQGLYSYLKNNFWVKKMQFRRFLKKIPAATFFVNWFWKWLPRPFQRCRNRQWYILFHLNFILHHCGLNEKRAAKSSGSCMLL